MHVLEHFSVPYLGLKNGRHQFVFEVDDAFFAAIENSIIQSGSFEVILELEKRSDMGIAVFDFEGSATMECDRCLSNFEMPIDGTSKIHIKYGEEDNDDEELMVILPETSKINFAQFIYESIGLSLPLIKAHESIEDCDQDMIEKMNGAKDTESTESIWNSLKNIDFN